MEICQLYLEIKIYIIILESKNKESDKDNLNLETWRVESSVPGIEPRYYV